MRERLQSITSKLWSWSAIVFLIVIWQLVCVLGLVESFMLPSPVSVVKAFVEEFDELMLHLRVTLIEAVVGLALGVALGFIIAVAMDAFEVLYKVFYPVIILTQTVPTVAIAPLLVLWFGYEMLPKVILVVMTTFFTIAV